MDNYAVIRPFVDPATVTDVYVITDVTSGQVQSTDQAAADAAAE